jgi:hypothetical protein
MFTAIRAETAHSPTYQLLRGEIKKRGGRSPGSGNQVIAGGWNGAQGRHRPIKERALGGFDKTQSLGWHLEVNYSLVNVN